MSTQIKDMTERMTQMKNEIISLRQNGTSNNIEQIDIGANIGHVSYKISSHSLPKVTDLSTLASILV